MRDHSSPTGDSPRADELYIARQPLRDNQQQWASQIARSVVKLSYRGRQATGVLTSAAALSGQVDSSGCPQPVTEQATHVLFAAHSLDAAGDSVIIATGARTSTAVVDCVRIPHTDVAVGRLAIPMPEPHLPVGLGGRFSRHLGVVAGFGGVGADASNYRTPRMGPVTIIGVSPFAMSANTKIKVRHALIMWPHRRGSVIWGDSGGPVVVRGQIIGIQSMLLPLPKGRGVSTATWLAPYRKQLLAIVEGHSKRRFDVTE